MENVVKREEIRATDPYDLYDLETNRSTSAENENRVSCVHWPESNAVHQEA